LARNNFEVWYFFSAITSGGEEWVWLTDTVGFFFF